MLTTVKLGICALVGAVLGLSVCVTVSEVPHPSIHAGLSPASAVIRLYLSKAQARGTKRSRRRERREAAELEAEQKRLDEREKELLGTKTPELGTTCAYDSYISAVSSSEIYTCGGNYYEKHEENGVVGFVGHPIGMDREEIKRAMARQAEAEKNRQAEAEKKRNENRKTILSSDCVYDSYASFAAATNIYTCGGVQFGEVEQNGTTSYVRGSVGGTGGRSEGAKGTGGKVESKGRTTAKEKPPQ